MSQLTIKLSLKADALIAHLQKEIFNRRRKKVSASGVVETLVESGAKSQSDKRFATSWSNLIKDIEKAAKLANTHGTKPSTLSDEEWAMILTHRNRKASTSARKPSPKRLSPSKSKASSTQTRVKKTSSTKVATQRKPAVKKASTPKAAVNKTITKKAAASRGPSKKVSDAARPARRARKSSNSKIVSARASSKRMTGGNAAAGANGNKQLVLA